MPFEYVFGGEPAPEEGFEAQEFYYSNLMRRPERNTITDQDTEVTRKRLRKAGIIQANNMRDYEMYEIAKIVGTGILIMGENHCRLRKYYLIFNRIINDKSEY